MDSERTFVPQVSLWEVLSEFGVSGLLLGPTPYNQSENFGHISSSKSVVDVALSFSCSQGNEGAGE